MIFAHVTIKMVDENGDNIDRVGQIRIGTVESEHLRTIIDAAGSDPTQLTRSELKLVNRITQDVEAFQAETRKDSESA